MQRGFVPRMHKEANQYILSLAIGVGEVALPFRKPGSSFGPTPAETPSFVAA
jgi:hypothetical protein